MLFEVGLYPEAVITAQLSPETMAVLGSSSGAAVPSLQIDLHGQVVSKDAVLTVSATDAGGFSATTSQPILLNAAEFNLEDGVAALERRRAQCDQSVIPVTASLEFHEGRRRVTLTAGRYKPASEALSGVLFGSVAPNPYHLLIGCIAPARPEYCCPGAARWVASGLPKLPRATLIMLGDGVHSGSSPVFLPALPPFATP